MDKNKNSRSHQTTLTIQVSAWQPVCEREDGALEESLGWPSRTLGWLRAAFMVGARRQMAWDLGDLGPEDVRAAAMAAAVFRRGVATVYRPLVLQASPSVISLGKSLLEGISADLSGRDQQLFFVIDDAVAKSWPAVGELAGKFPSWIFKGGEAAKNLASMAALVKQLGSERCTVVAIGGGVTLDLAGFAAGLLGCGHINIPTTLLAMADAAVGGKTGVNFEAWGKNQVGLFHFPERVIVCAEFLHTLPKEEIRAGGAECLKHALLAEDMDLLEQWAEFLRDPSLNDTNSSEINSMITAVAEMKEAFVRVDPFEHGSQRELLNLGHTIAHSLEAVDGLKGVAGKRDPKFGLRHGTAVAFGLMCKVQLMVAIQPEAADTGRKIVKCLTNSGCLDDFRLWYAKTGLGAGELWSLMVPFLMQDKKIKSHTPSMCRIVGLQWNSVSGKPVPAASDVSMDDLRAAFEKALLN